MKFNFKKIASVLATTVMLGSTVAFAAAAWPAPLVTSGVADAALVVGASAASTDMAAATSVANALNAKVTATGDTTVEGDSVKLEKSSDKFSLSQELNDFMTTLDSEDLGIVLAEGTYLNQDNNDYDYEQEIALGAEPLVYNHDQDYNDDKPTAGFFMSSGVTVLTYTLDFTNAAECGTAFSDCDNNELEMLGKTFFISNAENISTGVKLTLLDSANIATVSEGETKTLTVGSKTYEVAIDFVDSAETKLTVNGVTTNSLNEGETYKLADGTFVGIKDISYSSKETGISKVEFTLGMGKLIVSNGTEVQLNDEDISTLEDENGV